MSTSVGELKIQRDLKSSGRVCRIRTPKERGTENSDHMSNVCVVCHVKRVQTQLDNLLFAASEIVVPELRNDENFLESQVELKCSRSAGGVTSDAPGTVIGQRIPVAVEAGGDVERRAGGCRKDCPQLETSAQFQNFH